MKKLFFVCIVLILCGCNTIRKPILKQELKQAVKLRDETIPKKFKKALEEGKMTQYQIDKLKPGIEYVLKFIIERAEKELEIIENE